MSSVNGKSTGKTYWRSLDELCDSPEFRERVAKEFPSYLPEAMTPSNRRNFLKLMGASLALAGVTGCNNPDWPRWPKTKILPYAYRPPGRSPGEPEHFATALEMGGYARPVLAKSYDGRPIKIEGNPEHPASRGGADLLAQASVLGLYDPDRSRGVARLREGHESELPWEVFEQELGAALEEPAAARGRGFAILAEASASPSLRSLRRRIEARFPSARWYEYESISRDNALEGASLVFGEPQRAVYDLDEAEVIVSLDDDFLMAHPASIANTKAFARQRRPESGSMTRLYSVESTYSITGSVADHRYAVKPSAVAEVAWSLAARLFLDDHGLSLPGNAGGLQSALREAQGHGGHYPFLEKMAADLLNHRGHALVTVGPGQPPAVHALAHVINEALEAVGSCVRYVREESRPTHVEAIAELVGEMSANRVKALLVLGGNPVYDAPADVDFATALKGVRFSAHLSLYRDETSRACNWHVPRAHYLEAWSDSRSYDGTYTLTQPLIEPLYGGKTPAELLALILEGRPVSGQEIVQKTFSDEFGAVRSRWERAVHDGFVANSAPRAENSRITRAWRPTDADVSFSHSSQMEVVFLQDYTVYDGRFANNGWLQELPDPMSKLTWDNAALLNPVKARDLGLKQGDLVELRAGDRAITLPAYLLPGQAMESIGVAVGYGRTHGGRVATGSGTHVGPLRTRAHMTLAAVEIRKAGGHYDLVTTQDHHAINNKKQGQGQAERLPELFRETTFEHYQEEPDFVHHVGHHAFALESLWQEHSYDEGHKWGMTIDLSACTGCGACVVACQAENNIPIVGKAEVSVGREMHWIRVDRYFQGELEDPAVAHHVVTCHQCENAPCEQVCPVAATTHNSEGLNDMVYNRCIGTRYCSNNCPYKVRRFNWFNNSRKPYNEADLFQMQRNPDVTVRSRGVMEKCTYCVQRIKAVTIPAKNERRAVEDGEIVPACAQTCPADAIVFGDLNDPKSKVRQLQQGDRAYAMLAELNVKPRTKYLGKVRNPADGHGGGGHSHHARSAEQATETSEG